MCVTCMNIYLDNVTALPRAFSVWYLCSLEKSPSNTFFSLRFKIESRSASLVHTSVCSNTLQAVFNFLSSSLHGGISIN